MAYYGYFSEKPRLLRIQPSHRGSRRALDAEWGPNTTLSESNQVSEGTERAIERLVVALHSEYGR